LKVGIVSDVHGNFHALKAVEEKMDRLGVEKVWFLGDAVGYGAFPNECVRWLRSNADLAVLGNHELAVLGFVDLNLLNDLAAKALAWCKEVLTDENLEYLGSLPIQQEAGRFQLVHDTPAAPGSMEYILTKEQAYKALLAQRKECCFFGHTHLPAAYRLLGASVDSISPPTVIFQGGRYLINPGSVGQPRDRDPRASFGVLNPQEGTFSFYRVEYPVKEAAKAILDRGLPQFLAARLILGV
jgi:diadenosine tetraphosphatase ApaH/serine/threonine PP2A family protein phosphatase